MTTDKPQLKDHHLFLSIWITPWSWLRPNIYRSKYSRDWTICFGFGQLEYIVD